MALRRLHGAVYGLAAGSGHSDHGPGHDRLRGSGPVRAGRTAGLGIFSGALGFAGRSGARAACAPLILYFFLNRGGTGLTGFYVQNAMLWFPLIYLSYSRGKNDSRLWQYWKWALLGAMALTTLTTIGWLIEGMLRDGRIYAYSRSLGYAEPGREAYLKELMLRNIGGYDFIYATVVSLPFTCVGISGKPRLETGGLYSVSAGAGADGHAESVYLRHGFHCGASGRGAAGPTASEDCETENRPVAAVGDGSVRAGLFVPRPAGKRGCVLLRRKKG